MRIFLLLLLLFTSSFSLNFGNKVLEANEAFQVKSAINEDSLNIKLELGKDIYLYDDKLKIYITKPQKLDITKELNIPKPVTYEGFIVHFDNLDLNISKDLLKSKIDSNSFEIELKFQGCSTDGLCYAPESEKIALDFDTNRLIIDKKSSASLEDSNEIDTIVNNLKDKTLFLVLITFFVFGLLLSLTPCIFPMIPILSSIIVNYSKNGKMSAGKGFFLSLIYVLSMSVAYTIAGVIAGLFGANLQAMLQNPYVLVIFALFFVLLALSMFGYFDIRLPSSISSRLSKSTNKKGLTGIAIMGFLSALIVGPCVAPPLAGALVYIGQTGDALLGGMALFVLSLGMGVPLLLIGVGFGKFMPKPGAWMQAITKLFGIIMLGVAIWLLNRVLNPTVTILLWALLFLGTAIYIKAYKHILVKLTRTVIYLLGVIFFIGAVSGATSILNPLEKFTSNMALKESSKALNFKTIKNVDELELAIKESNKPIMLDFWASWCISCIELDEITFSDEKVIEKLQSFTLLKADVTANSEANIALQKRFKVVGPPALIFWDKDKKEVNASKIIGYKNPEEFLEIVNKNFPN